jgi:hypothetical protein
MSLKDHQARKKKTEKFKKTSIHYGKPNSNNTFNSNLYLIHFLCTSNSTLGKSPYEATG